MDKKPKVIDGKAVFPTKKNSQKEMRNAIASLKDMAWYINEISKLQAAYKKNHYDDLVEQGFSKEEALEVIKSSATPYGF